MSLYRTLRPLIFSVDAEKAHRATITALRLRPGGRRPKFPAVLASRIAGIDFPSPVGLAAGFDKDAQVPDAMLATGFGFVEVGTLTPQPQPGNPRPRLFRLVEDEAVINRFGFNNGGQAAALERLLRRRARGGVVGVNIGANKDATDRIADYVTGVTVMRGVASYLTVNVSSPNTPGLRTLQSRDALDELLAAVVEARGRQGPPIFLKLAPDLTPADMDDIAEVSLRRGVDALIVSNTTISRPSLLSPLAGETGGLSGAPLHDLALRRLIDFRAATAGHMPLIAAGGIATADQAYARILAGASLVQLYSALVYQGPGLAKRIADGLATLLARDGFGSVADAVGRG
ncbi:quinone-dependent dihydroorotate dehydrogenase [Sphingomonas solaris]|uniref:Dihydroorotate dehydrogenase (quinone) n=1 Tax=Alterirhizorhabdus solaris TaxID=2529389 RepID=A0A558RCZ9_9SPHN|nr:quinone-dependent dihydroorotate dehydrogenase [Sphingomonas solaris]TVV77210.1 quinone-dependent dihydroorotate dehydrogenase [Sphingomonas solaris]